MQTRNPYKTVFPVRGFLFPVQTKAHSHTFLTLTENVFYLTKTRLVVNIRATRNQPVVLIYYSGYNNSFNLFRNLVHSTVLLLTTLVPFDFLLHIVFLLHNARIWLLDSFYISLCLQFWVPLISLFPVLVATESLPPSYIIASNIAFLTYLA